VLQRCPFPDDALIYRAGLLTARARGAVGLEQLLEDFFGVDVEIEQFVGGWYRLQPDDWCIIGDDEDGARLGESAVAGDEIWDQQARVRVRLGPLTRARYDSFLPGREGHAALGALLRLFSHDAVDFVVQPVLAADEVPVLELGTAPPGTQQLGWSTWIRSGPRERDADETVLTLQKQAAS
jgi:type VI secretion system protein ImpH